MQEMISTDKYLPIVKNKCCSVGRKSVFHSPPSCDLKGDGLIGIPRPGIGDLYLPMINGRFCSVESF